MKGIEQKIQLQHCQRLPLTMNIFSAQRINPFALTLTGEFKLQLQAAKLQALLVTEKKKKKGWNDGSGQQGRD